MSGSVWSPVSFKPSLTWYGEGALPVSRPESPSNKKEQKTQIIINNNKNAAAPENEGAFHACARDLRQRLACFRINRGLSAVRRHGGYHKKSRGLCAWHAAKGPFPITTTYTRLTAAVRHAHLLASIAHSIVFCDVCVGSFERAWFILCTCF